MHARLPPALAKSQEHIYLLVVRENEGSGHLLRLVQNQPSLHKHTTSLLMTSDPPDCAMGEVIPGLWVGNLMSVSKMLQLHHENNINRETHLTIISVLTNPNLIRLVSDILEQNRLKQLAKSSDANSHTIRIKHEVIELKDLAETDLLSVLPNALMLIDDALGCQTASGSGNGNDDDGNNDINQQRICLVQCARGASRSVSIVIAYLLSRHGSKFKSFDDALQRVRRVRPVAQPNIGFSLALQRFERTLRTIRRDDNFSLP